MVFSIKNLLQGKLSGFGLDTFGQVQVGSRSKGYSQTLNKSTLWADSGNDITCTGGKWTRIGEYTIPAQQRIHLGYGVSGGNPEEIGHLHFDLVDDTATNSAQEAGEVRVGYTDASERMFVEVMRERTEDLSDTDTSTGIARNNELLLPETPPEMKGGSSILALENSKLVVDFKADSTDVVVETGIGTGAINKWKLPITVYSVQ